MIPPISRLKQTFPDWTVQRLYIHSAVFFVNTHNPVNELTIDQSAFRHFMEGKTIMNPPKEDVVGGMGGIISQTADYANYSNAIGFSFRFYANEMVNNKDVKLLKINEIYPELGTIKNSTYPLSSQFFAVSLADNNKPNVIKLLDWLKSEQAQYLVEKTGYCPLE